MPTNSLSSSSFFIHLLLAITTISSFSSVLGAATRHLGVRDVGSGRATQCRVKRRGAPGMLVDGTIPNSENATVANSPTSTLQETTPISGAGAAAPSPTAFVWRALPPFDYGRQKVRGVNLGGWFMMEPWITPSMFERTGNDAIVDEYTFGLYQDWEVAYAALQVHWSTFYTEQDFAEIAAAGLNHVRIPISYWSVPMEQDTGPYIKGAWPYILTSLEWANAHGLYVILDLHGAPGSQNGFDNSGQRTGNPTFGTDWQKNVEQTLDVLETIARELGDKVAMIQLLNEVAGFRGQQWGDTARGFWQAGYDRVRAAAGNNVKVMIGDAFLGLHNWNGYMKQAQGVIMDLHVYQIFSNDELARSWDDHISHMCSRREEFTNYAYNNLWLVMGEWTAAPTDCCKYLNGRGVGSRWDGTYYNGGDVRTFGSCYGMTGSHWTFSNEYKAFLRKYWEAQVTVAEMANGWVYWTWKAENSDDWSYQKGIEGGFIPSNPDDRLYPNICG